MLKEGDRLVTGHRLIRFLGRGNFGEVWQATAPGNTYAALKFVNLEQTQGRKEYRAIQPLKHLRHANLLQMTAIWLLDENGDIIPDDVVMEGMPLFLETVRGTLATVPVLPDQHRASTLIIAMPFADKSLDQLLKEYKQKGQSGIPRDELLAYMQDAAKAIDFLNSPHHDLGQGPVAIRHCDVKPENLLLMGQSVVLCDFGVSRAMGSASRKTAMGGSLAYMAPECLADDVSPYSDQFSLAISYLELRTGLLPFESVSPAALMEQRRRGVLDLSSLPKGEAAVIRRATAVQPERRYPSALAMVEALQQAGTKPTARRAPVLLALSMLTIVGLGAALAAWPYLTRKPTIADHDGEPGPKTTTSPWEEPERTAHQLIQQDGLSESQFQEAVEQLCRAIDLGLPENRLVFPHPLTPTLALKLTPDEILFEPAFNPFAFSPKQGIAAVQRTVNGLTAVTYWPSDSAPSSTKVIDATFEFDRAGNLGWLNDRLAVFAQSGDRQSLTALSLDGQARETLFDSSDNNLIDVCIAASGRRAVVANWDAKRLTSLAHQQTTWTLPQLNPDEDPLLQLTHEGDWVAILTSDSVYVANLSDPASEFQRLAFGSTKSAVERKTFSFQVDETNGWLTTDSGLDDAKAKLVRFTLADPQAYETIDLTAAAAHATCAALHKRTSGVDLFVGYDNSRSRYFPNVNDRTAFMDATLAQEESHEHEVVVSAIGQSEGAGPEFLYYATRDGGVFLQRLQEHSPTLEMTKSPSGVPRQMSINQSRLAIGFEKGAVEVFDLNHCRLIYEAASKRDKVPRPSAVSSTIKS